MPRRTAMRGDEIAVVVGSDVGIAVVVGSDVGIAAAAGSGVETVAAVGSGVETVAAVGSGVETVAEAGSGVGIGREGPRDGVRLSRHHHLRLSLCRYRCPRLP